MGIRPDRYQQLVDAAPYSVIQQTLDQSAPILKAQVAGLPSHGEFLAQQHRSSVPPDPSGDGRFDASVALTVSV